MATRFFFPDGVSAPVAPPSPSASDWAHQNSATGQLLVAPDTSALATVAVTPDSADDLTDRNTLHRQYVSNALFAQTIGVQAITGQFQASETFANDNLFLALAIQVISNDGSTVRATLLAITRATSLEVATTLTNRTFPSTNTSSFTCVDGDRILILVGCGGNITSGAGGVIGHNASMRWGCSASGGDLPANETETGATFRPWVQFANNLLFVEQSGPPADQFTSSGGMSGRRWV